MSEDRDQVTTTRDDFDLSLDRDGATKAPTKVAYHRPDVGAIKRKRVLPLCMSDVFFAQIQILGPDGANNLHAHTATDGFYYVLAGRARFHGSDEEVIAELGAHEGVFLPRGTAYWFESVGEEPLEMLQAGALAKDEESLRVNYGPRRMSRTETENEGRTR